MKISNASSMRKKNALLIVAGSQSAVLYRIYGGQITLLSEIKVPRPQYTDREGFFARRGGGRMFGTGSVYEPDTNHLQSKFVQELCREVHGVNFNFEEVLLCAPAESSRSIKNGLPISVRQRVVREIQGNLMKQHPTEILKKMDREIESSGGPVIPLNMYPARGLAKNRRPDKYSKRRIY